MKRVVRKSSTDNGLYERQAVLFKAFANPTRIHLIDLLGRGEVGASDLQERLGISKANLSQHLSILRSAGMVNTRREGKRLMCGISSREVKDAYNQVRLIMKYQAKQRHM